MTATSGVTALADTDRLAGWLRAHAGDFRGGIAIAPLAGGQSNPTFRISAGDHQWVLRRKPPGVLLASAHAVDREFRVMRALADTPVPVPGLRALCEDDAVIGSAFYVMDFVEGRVLADPTLPGMAPHERGAIYAELQRVIAAIHRVDVAAAGLSDYGKPANYLARQIDRWSRQYRASETERIEAMERLIEWLPAHRPQDDEMSLVHGDFRIDNLIFHPTEPRALAVIDWELSTLGHPVADFAYHCMAWRVTPDEFRGIRGHDLAALGIPDEAAHAAGYCRHAGRGSLPHWEYHLAFNMFRMAAILQGILARARAGNAAAADAEATGLRARRMAEAGWRVVEQGRAG
jgi:aminoglycoside phosphotransferase (APT) family kinase protein